MGLREFEEESDGDEGGGKVYREFDCPGCDANNPWDEGFKAGDEVRCHYCGNAYKVFIAESGRLRFKEL